MTKVCSSTFSPTLLEVLLFLSLRQSYGFRIGSTGGVTIKSIKWPIHLFYGHDTDLIFATALHHFHQGLPRPNSFHRDSDDHLDQHLAAPQAISSIYVRSSFEYSAAQPPQATHLWTVPQSAILYLAFVRVAFRRCVCH